MAIATAYEVAAASTQDGEVATGNAPVRLELQEVPTEGASYHLVSGRSSSAVGAYVPTAIPADEGTKWGPGHAPIGATLPSVGTASAGLLTRASGAPTKATSRPLVDGKALGRFPTPAVLLQVHAVVLVARTETGVPLEVRLR